MNGADLLHPETSRLDIEHALAITRAWTRPQDASSSQLTGQLTRVYLLFWMQALRTSWEPVG